MSAQEGGGIARNEVNFKDGERGGGAANRADDARSEGKSRQITSRKPSPEISLGNTMGELAQVPGVCNSDQRKGAGSGRRVAGQFAGGRRSRSGVLGNQMVGAK